MGGTSPRFCTGPPPKQKWAEAPQKRGGTLEAGGDREGGRDGWRESISGAASQGHMP